MGDFEILSTQLRTLVDYDNDTGFKTFGDNYGNQVIFKALKNTKNTSGLTALHVVASTDQNLIFGWLLHHLTDQQQYKLLKVKDNSGNLPIHYAARAYGAKVLNKMLRRTIDVRVQLLQIQNAKGATALHCAAINGHTSSMENMIEDVSDVVISDLLHIRNEEGNTAVFEGLRKGKAIPVGMQRHITGDLLTSAHGNILHCIALDGEIEAVGKKEEIKNLLDLITADELFNLMEEKNESGRTPMHCVMLQRDVEVAKAMLTMAKECCGTDKCMELLKEWDGNGDTPLHCATAADPMVPLEQILGSFELLSDRQQWLAMPNSRGETAIKTATVASDRLNETIKQLQAFNN